MRLFLIAFGLFFSSHVAIAAGSGVTPKKPNVAPGETRKSGESQLQLDVTGWNPPMPTTLAEVIWALRYTQNAKNVKFDDPDIIHFGYASPDTVDDVLKILVSRIYELEARVTVLEP